MIVWNFITLILVVLAQKSYSTCTNSFQGYLNCIKSNLDRNYSLLESDFTSSIKRKVNQCFTKTPASVSKCFFDDAELIRPDAFGAGGPLRACQGCQKIVGFLRNKFTSLTKSEGACMRRQLALGIKNEVAPCVRANSPDRDFNMPRIPDFDANGYPYRQDMMKNVERTLLMFSRLDFCKEKNYGRYVATSKCLESANGTQPKHCQVIKSCTRDALNGCSQFVTVEQNTCQCIRVERDGIKNKITSLSEYVEQVVKTNQELQSSQRIPPTEASRKKGCVRTIKGILARDETPRYAGAKSWMSFVDEAIQCVPGSKILNTDNLISIGCTRLINAKSIKKSDIKVMIHFIINLVDSLIERVNRFCSAECN